MHIIDSCPPLSRRKMLGLAVGTTFAISQRLYAQPARVFRPEDFGARGDGRTNDTLAFASLSRAVEANGGGIIHLSPNQYVVGLQRPGDGHTNSFEPSPILRLRNLPGALRIEGNGAVLKAAPGLHFGAFEPRGGGASSRPMPNYDQATLASPYVAMVWVESCSGPVTISGIELDGMIHEAVIGGEYGDMGRQIPMSGIFLRDNSGGEKLSDISSHHHGLDGIIIDGISHSISANRVIERLRLNYNGRQGCSLVGGHDYQFRDCEFSHTGRAVIASAPGAGLDIEAEGEKTVAGLRFRHCRFSDNVGCGVVADSGPSRDVTFEDCQMIGTTNWANWSAKPGYVYNQCTFVGSSVRPWGSSNASEATQFNDCQFTDDSRLSPTGKVYLPDPRLGGPILDAGGAFEGGRNVTLRRCAIALSGLGLLPWSVNTIYQDCSMRQTSARQSFPRGTYRGTNRLNGNAVLDGSRYEGPTYLNGRRMD